MYLTCAYLPVFLYKFPHHFLESHCIPLFYCSNKWLFHIHSLSFSNLCCYPQIFSLCFTKKWKLSEWTSPWSMTSFSNFVLYSLRYYRLVACAMCKDRAFLCWTSASGLFNNYFLISSLDFFSFLLDCCHWHANFLFLLSFEKKLFANILFPANYFLIISHSNSKSFKRDF